MERVWERESNVWIYSEYEICERDWNVRLVCPADREAWTIFCTCVGWQKVRAVSAGLRKTASMYCTNVSCMMNSEMSGCDRCESEYEWRSGYERCACKRWKVWTFVLVCRKGIWEENDSVNAEKSIVTPQEGSFGHYPSGEPQGSDDPMDPIWS